MALKGKWQDKVDGKDYVMAQDINDIANAVIEIEEEKESENTIDVVQKKGNSESSVMSQKAVTYEIDGIQSTLLITENILALENEIPRKTALGASVADGSKTTVEKILGKTVVVDNVLKSSKFSKIISMGRNLFKPVYSSTTNNGVVYTVNADKSITVKGTATAKSYFTLRYWYEKNAPAGYYTFSGNPSPVAFLVEARQDSTYVKTLLNGSGTIAIDWVGYNQVRIQLYVYTGYTADCTVYPMCNVAGKALPYEPYTESEFTLPEEITLYNFDYIDVAEKKIIRQSKQISPRSTSNWSINGTVGNGNLRFGMVTNRACIAHSLVCSHYTSRTTVTSAWAAGEGILMYNNGYIEIIDTRYTTLEAWKAHLAELEAAGKPLELIYQEASATEEAISLSSDGYTVYKDGLEALECSSYETGVTIKQSYDLLRGRSARQPIITFLDDDGSPESLQNWELIGDASGIRNTFALVTGRDDMNWDEVERLQNKGFEFISHTHTHPDLDTLTESAMREELKTSIAALKEHQCESRYLVYPYNWVNSDSMEIIKKYFRAGIWGEDRINTLPIEPYKLTRFSVLSGEMAEKEINGVTRNVSLYKSIDDFKAIIDMAVETGGWVIFMSHLFTNETSGYYFDDEVKNLFVDVIKYAGLKGAKIETFGTAFEKVRNNIAVGSISDSDHFVVDCEGTVLYN